MRQTIVERAHKLDEWINQQGVKNEQAHLIKDSRENVYWHYGYLEALKDVLARLSGEIIIDHRQGKHN